MRIELLKKRNDDPFKLLGVSNEDKMSFFLLKWVFNAIKKDSDKEDPKHMGKPFVLKKELVQQLVKNPELLNAMNFTNTLVLEKEIKRAKCVKENCLTWAEFLNFFFLKDTEEVNEIAKDVWWNKIDMEGKKVREDDDKINKKHGSYDIKKDSDEDEENSEEMSIRKQRLLNEL